jgi:hypothetical protein
VFWFPLKLFLNVSLSKKFSASYYHGLYVIVLLLYYIIFIIIIFSGSAAQPGLQPLRSRVLVITYNDAPQSVGLLWTSDQLVAETST